MNWESLFTKIIKLLFSLLFFSIPLFFLPVNYELFEFNKMVLVYGFTTLVVFLWLLKSIFTGKFTIAITPLDLPIILYLISSVISTINSIHPYTSIFGYYSRFHGGLLSTICYIVLYYAYLSNKENAKTKQDKTNPLLLIIIISAVLVTSWGVLEHFGIDAKYWIQDVRNRVFSTFGQPNWLGAFIDALIFIPLGLALLTKSNKKFVYYIFYAIFFFCLIFTNSKSAILAFFIALTVFSILFVFKEKKQTKPLATVWIATFFIYLVLGQRTLTYVKKLPLWINIFNKQTTITLPPANNNPASERIHISESSDIRQVVWKGALDVWKHYPVFGSGLETFAYSYYQHKPVEHNLLSEWDFLYNKAHNEFLNILACQGIIGLISYLSIVIVFTSWVFKQIITKKNHSFSNYMQIPLFAGFLTILITNFFGFSVVVIGLFFFFFPALAYYENCPIKTFNLPVRGLLKDFFVILSFGLTIYCLYLVLSIWRADYYFNRSQKQSSANLINSFLDLKKAVEIRPKEPMFHNQLAVTASRLAAHYWQNEATESAELAQELEALAVYESQLTLNLNPVHLNFFKIQAQTYSFLSLIKPEYNKEIVRILEEATKLGPTDAKTFYLLGMQHEENKNYEKAIEAWEKTVFLKPDYQKARLDLAQLYWLTGKKDQAKGELKFILQNIDNYDKASILLLQEWDKQ